MPRLELLREDETGVRAKEVFRELERPGQISTWVEERRAALNEPRGMPPEYARSVGLVQRRFPGMGKAMGAKERADPFVVGLALTYNTEHRPWIVVCSESRRNRPLRKIPGVSDELGILCITLEELIERELPDDERPEE